MSDVLSEDQIAALFAAADDGRLPEPGASAARARAEQAARVHTIDFTRPSKFTKDQERQLRRAHETFCRTAGSRLSSELRTPLDLEVIGHKQLTWTSAIAEVPPGSAVAVARMSPTDGQLLIAVDRPFLLALIERQLGGEVEPLPPDRRMTDIDVALSKQLLRRMLEQLSIVWDDMAGIQLVLHDFDPEPVGIQLAPLSEPTWLLTIEARLGSSSFLITVLLPYRSIERIEDRLPSVAPDGADDGDPIAARQVQAAIGEAEIELRAEVAAVELPAEQVLALKVGDVLRLPSDSGSITVYAGDVPVHRAKPGRSGRRRAIQVLGRPLGGAHA